MLFYNLRRVPPDGRIDSEAANSKSEALEKFGKNLKTNLTLENQGKPAEYEMAEREEPQGWVGPYDIPVWEKS